MDQENVSLREKVKKISSQMEEVQSERDHMEKKMKDTKKRISF
jgi:outer membrane murein-binding lipoprotein Lpp